MTGIDRDDVLTRVDLAEVLTREVGPPKKRGVEWWWPSVDPAMAGTGRTPPTHIVPPAGDGGVERFKDFASGLTGTAVDVVMIRRGVDFPAALAALAEDHGVSGRVLRPLPPLPSRRWRRSQAPSAELVAWVRDCAARLATRAHSPSAKAREWLQQRGFGEQLLIDNLVGYDPGARSDPHRPKQERQRHGIPNMAGVTFPMFDAAGEVSYVQTRSLTWTPTSDHPKYVNPAGVTNPAVGFWVGGEHPAGSPVLVTEGPTDSLAARQAGFDVAGLIGASHADNEATAAKLVAALGADRPYVIVTDADAAGRRAGQLLVVHLWISGATAILRPPPTGDVADWAQGSGEAFPQELATHVDRALGDVSDVTRHALGGDPDFIGCAVGGELGSKASEVWDSYLSSGASALTPPVAADHDAGRRVPAPHRAPRRPPRVDAGSSWNGATR